MECQLLRELPWISTFWESAVNSDLLGISLLLGALGLALIPLLHKLFSPNRLRLPVSIDWIENISAGSYRPMQRLLAGDDFAFLLSHPGQTRRAVQQLRRERRKIFRGYLRCLRRDFNLICTGLQVLMMQSTYDRPDLAGLLISQKIRFQVNLMLVELHLLLHACGCNNLMDVRDLVTALDVLGRELRQMVPRTTDSARSFA